METLYVSDLDGTLLGNDSQLSERSVELLNGLLARGVHFTVATARTPATVSPLLSRLSMRLPAVVMSGAALWNLNHKRFIDTKLIETENVRLVLDIMSRHGMCPMIYRCCGDRLQVHHRGELNTWEKAFVAQREGLALKRFCLNDPQLDDHLTDALLLFSMGNPERLEAISREIADCGVCEVVYYRDNLQPEVALLEVYRRGTSKSAAIARVASMASAMRIVAFGDNVNDLPMLDSATHAVAVGNAVPQVKAIAHEVIGTNTADSVARYIAADIANHEF